MLTDNSRAPMITLAIVCTWTKIIVRKKICKSSETKKAALHKGHSVFNLNDEDVDPLR